MKFAKVLEIELVPEWKKKYIDYKGLKCLLKSIERSRIIKNEKQREREIIEGSNQVSITIPQNPKPQHRSSTLSFDSFSSFASKVSNTIRHKQSSSSQKESLFISYDTLWDQINPQEKKFFKALEDNLNKIEKFYEEKINEAINRFEELNAQYKLMNETMVKHKARSQQVEQAEEAEYHLKYDMDYKSAKKLIRKAVLEFYRGIELLKNYKILNKTGFVKILKKYDKVAKRNGSDIYLPRISNYNFVKSLLLDKLITETENFYIKNFEEGVRSLAMKHLRLPNKELQSYHFVTWRVGLYIGLSLPVLVSAIEQAFSNRTAFDQISWPIVLQIYSAYFIPIVFTLLFGINMCVWSKARINYKFIFEFDPRHNLDFRQFLEIPALMLLIFSYIIYIAFTVKTSITFEQYVWILGIILLSIFLCPFRILYYSSRRWLIIVLFRIITSGFHRVEFRDFFIADELNSLTYTFASTQLLFCAVRECDRSLSFLTPLLACLPPWWRLIQCSRRYFVTHHKFPHLVNAGKYFSTIMAVWFLFFFRSSDNNIARSFWIGGQIFSSIYTLLWDLLMDWSLLQLHSQNYLLRNELSFKHHSIYYFAIISNGLLRFSWILQLIIPGKYAKATLFAIAFGEMLRRWQWNFFRLENEHINNCGQFRAIKEIPLPFEKEIIHYESELKKPQQILASEKPNNLQNWRDYEPRSDFCNEEVNGEQLSEIDSVESLNEQSKGKNNSNRSLNVITLGGSRSINNDNRHYDTYSGPSTITKG